MVLTAPTFRFHFPPGFDDRAEFEMPAKGYLAGGVVETADGSYPVTFFDPIRLAQDLELAAEHGPGVVAEPGLVVVSEVTREVILGAIAELLRQQFFDHIRACQQGHPEASVASDQQPTHCVFCRTDSPPGAFCPSCGKAKRKWCPSCAEWRAPSFTTQEVDHLGGISASFGEFEQEALHCPQCGTPLQDKSAPRG